MLPPMIFNDKVKLTVIACAFSALAGLLFSASRQLPVRDTIPVVQKIYDASCTIRVKLTTEDPYVREWLGSGVCIAERGLILTNWHVADDEGVILSREYEVEFPNKQKYAAAFVYSDKSKDLGLLQLISVNPLELTTVKFGGYLDIPRIGQPVWVIGSPFGLKNTVTKGIISALDRVVKLRMHHDIVTLKGMIQTDAPINSGNSGGGLFNIDGKLIGIVNSGRHGDGIGFAIPLEVVTVFLLESQDISKQK